ncbi:unnamed protein product [Symbiodinium sp. CCMP2456]|nr:unnamed protein product [Symbiodinium sp. CCMP2456]
MEANEVPYVIKICSKMDPESLEVQNRTRALWKKRKAIGDGAAEEEPALADAAGSAEDVLAEPADALPLMDAPPVDAAKDFPPVQDAQDYVMPEAFSPQASDHEDIDGPVASSSRGEALETVNERFDRLSKLYGHAAALMLCGAVQEGVHYDPHEGRWKTLNGLVCPYEPSASVAETPEGAAEDSHAGSASVDQVKQCLLAELQVKRERIMAGAMPDIVDTCPMLPDDASLDKARLFNGSSCEAFPCNISIEDTPEHSKPILALIKHLDITASEAQINVYHVQCQFLINAE